MDNDINNILKQLPNPQSKFFIKKDNLRFYNYLESQPLEPRQIISIIVLRDVEKYKKRTKLSLRLQSRTLKKYSTCSYIWIPSTFIKEFIDNALNLWACNSGGIFEFAGISNKNFNL